MTQTVQPTGAGWAARAARHLPELLLEQAHLEKKAAAAATAFLFRIGDAEGQLALSRLAREELSHFERAVKLLGRRGIALLPQQPCAYAERLKGFAARTMPQRLVDELLVAAMIEARSCERMALLGEELAGVDGEVARFYRELVAAEARHQDDYRAIAVRLAGRDAVEPRWRELCTFETALLHELPFAPRLHSGEGAVQHA